MITSRRHCEVIETRSVFLSTIHHVYVVHMQKTAYFPHAQRGFLSVVCRQLSLPLTLSRLRWWSEILFFEIVDGFWASRRVFHQLLNGQLVDEFVRCFVGILQPPFLSLCVHVCCPIHDNLVKIWRTSFLHVRAIPHLWCWCLCVGNKNKKLRLMELGREFAAP